MAEKEKRIVSFEHQAAVPSFWDDPEAAQKTMQELTEVREEVGRWTGLARHAADLRDLFELAVEEGDEALIAEVQTETDTLTAELEQEEFVLALSGEHDRGNAILAIHAGAGGTESQDWVGMLLRMYLRWAEQQGFKTEIIDQTEGEEAGLKSVTVEVYGKYAYGYLKSERGVHRLVRLSPFDAAHRRHTSFALVEVMPELDDEIEIDINPDDLKIDVFRASGHGGQNVQKNSTAVRITHLPTGIVVACQNERSQVQNRERAMRVLKSRLYEVELEKREEEAARLKGKHVAMGWGNQIRSYVLHPYQMVKDHRTEYETSRTDLVLNGEIDGFVHAYLQSRVGEIL